MMQIGKHTIKIDIVFTWVDGGDIKHQQKMSPYYTGKNNWESTRFRRRYEQVNEIEYAIRSIIKFATFVNTIFIVTDGQTPSFLDKYNTTKKPNDPTITIVDHKEIFINHSSVLPVFNSMSIETLLYKIKGLSEHFIYFNDDFILLKKTVISDFFQDGIPIIRGKWSIIDTVNPIKNIHNFVLKLFGKPTKDKIYGYKRGQQNAAKILNFKYKYLRIDHTPTPMRKSTLEKYFQKFPEVEIANSKHRFRSPKQYLIQSLINHIEIKNKTCQIKKNFQLLYIGGSFKHPLFRYQRKLAKAKKDNTILFLCIQSLDKRPNDINKFIMNWLENNLSK